ncbi:tetratricopeptide repeat protein [Dolichospermum heterosporum]|uniref:histidine kinase n=1 Tax=Dolichospermum heterosporum TAC447 TaxID=747523 RepID=A0ABY5LVY6_9CYAN|nr:tetratricopeptide repeat protein [Dolichospermum heterosporum]UUO16166.1 tetratricopeptide repeat protein [Dolichospermum heterosporum TAC447]
MMNSDDIQSLISKADDLLRNRDSKQAIVIIQQVLEIEPDNIEALKIYAQSLVKLNKVEEALTIFEKALQLAPNNVSILRNYGSALLQVAYYDQSLNILDKALQIEPNNVKVLSTYIKALLKIKFYDKIFVIFERCLQLETNNIITLNSYGQALAEFGNYEKAFEIFEQSLRIEHNNTITLSNYGKALAEFGNYEKAFEVFEHSLKIKPNDLIALNSYGKALAEFGNYEKAFEVFERSLKIKPNDLIALNSYGKALAESGNYEKAFEIFDQSLQIEPNNIITLTSYGKALADTRNHEKACEILERFLQIKPNNLTTLINYGQALTKSGNHEKACEIFERFLQIEPNNIITLTNYGQALTKSGNYEKAYEIFEQSLQLQPNDIKTLTSYGQTLTESGNYEKACEIFEQSLQLQSDDIITIDRYCNTLTKYGKVLLDAKEFKKACEIFGRFLQIKSNNYISFIYARCLEQLGKYTDAISQLQTIDYDSLQQYHVNVIHISLGRLYYGIKLQEQGNKYFNLAIANSDDIEKSLLSSARSIFAHNPYNETAVKMLQQIAEESPRYSQALEMLTLNLSEEEYFKMVKSDYQSGVNDTEILNRAIYHKIANEISILKGIAYRILRFSQTEYPLLTGIINDIEDVLEEVNRRRGLEKSQIATISNDQYEQILAIISKTAHDISDFVNNQLAIIESKTRRAMRKLAVDDPHYKQFEKLLTQLEFTQIALNDLKAINEGIKIKNHHFKIKKLFEKWEANPHIDNASITLDVENGDSEFNGDEEKIKSILNELVENSLKHNDKKLDLNISISTQDIINPPGIRGATIPGEQKYLLIEFNDNGQGIPPDKKDWIFQPLKTTANEGYGSGLGLFIIRKTLTQMNGYIQETGCKGAKFKIYIPYTKSENS